jgi:flagellar basal body-associated protein FliL
MKQIIVMISMIALGITIAGFVMGFGDSADEVAEAAKEQISYVNIADPGTTE